MPRWSLLAAVLMLAGCPVGIVGDDDVGDDDSPLPDADPGNHGLKVTWAISPAVPGPSSGGATVEEVKVKLSSVRAIGDAAPGDGRTTATAVQLDWDGMLTPAVLTFAAAPTGLYSRIELGTGGDRETYEIKGEARVGNRTHDFRIEDDAALSIDIPVAVDLRPGTEATIPLTLDIGAVLAAVDFGEVQLDEGKLVLDEDDPQIGAVRTALARAFRAAAGAAP